jgi:hypothetical protein
MDHSRAPSLRPPYRSFGQTKHRFSHRPKRIARRAERDRFAFLVVPVVWLLGALGVIMLAGAALHYLAAGEANWPLYSLAGVPLLSALILLFFRLVRGHYYSSLDEP